VSEHEVVEAYIKGEIGHWGLFRRLTKLGISVGTALAVAGAMPAAVSSKDFSGLEQARTQAESEDAMAIDRIVALLAAQLERAPMETSLAPLSVTLARIGANNANLLACRDCQPIPLNIKTPTGRFEGLLAPAQDQSGGPNLNLSLGGSLGGMELSLGGTITPTPDDGMPPQPVKLGQVSLNFSGKVGDTPLNFMGHIGNIETFQLTN
jgi:hypothetical protein